MSLIVPLNHNCHIKCPICNHKNLYDLRIDELEKTDSLKMEHNIEIKYKFLTFITCKNPLCNYDIEVIGDVVECPTGKLTDIDITNSK